MSQGFTVVEAILTLSLFGFFMFAVFLVFQLGTQHFQLATLRQGLQLGATRVMLPLETDLRRTVSNSLLILNDASRRARFEGRSYRRDVVCLGSLRNWNAGASYDAATGAPLWDCYAIYYATREIPYGKLVREHVNVATGTARTPWVGLNPALHLNDDPTFNRLDQKILSPDVLEFAVTPSQGTYRIQLKLRGRAAGRDGAPGSQEIFEVDRLIKAENNL
ncbi:MAG: hypothetical protein AB1758_31780 [Candidatus Eremiobacterota bacterium]